MVTISFQYAMAGPVISAPSRLFPARSSSGWQPPAHSRSPAACCRLAAHERRLAAWKAPSSAAGHNSTRASAAARAARSNMTGGIAARTADCITRTIRTVARVPA